MATLARELRVSYAFVERNFNLVKRYWALEVAWFIYSVAHSLAMGFIGAGMARVGGQPVDADQLVLYLLVGSLVWSYLAVVFDAIGEMIAWERWEGTIEYTFMAPVTRSTHMIGSCLFAVVFGLIRTALILLVVVLFFQIDLSGANLLAGRRGAGGRQHQLRRARDHGVHAAAALPGAWRADGVHRPDLSAPLLRGLLPHRGDAGVDAGRGQGLPGHLRAERHPGQPAGGEGHLEQAGTLLPLLLIGAITIPLGVRIFTLRRAVRQADRPTEAQRVRG